MRNQVLILFILIVAAFAVGRYTTNVENATKCPEVQKELDKHVDTKRRTVTLKKPNGEVKTITTVDSSTDLKSKTKVKAFKPKTLNVSFLVGTGMKTRPDQPMLGLSISKPVMGPINMGVWAVDTEKEVIGGISIGADF